MEKIQYIQNAFEILFNINRILLIKNSDEEKISPLQFLIIQYLYKNNKRFCNITNLSKELGLRKSTISNSVSVLKKKGLIKKEEYKLDRRKVCVKLTDSGLNKLMKINKKSDIFLNKIKTLSENECDKLLRILNKIIISFYKEGFVDKNNLCVSCEKFINEKLICSKKNKKNNIFVCNDFEYQNNYETIIE